MNDFAPCYACRSSTIGSSIEPLACRAGRRYFLLTPSALRGLSPQPERAASDVEIRAIWFSVSRQKPVLLSTSQDRLFCALILGRLSKSGQRAGRPSQSAGVQAVRQPRVRRFVQASRLVGGLLPGCEDKQGRAALRFSSFREGRGSIA